MARGPGLDLSKVDSGLPLDTCFRVISSYDILTDIIITRIDVKKGDNQYCSAFLSNAPFEYKPGDKIRVTDGLITPKNGVINCINVTTAKEDLIRALTEIIEDLNADSEPLGAAVRRLGLAGS